MSLKKLLLMMSMQLTNYNKFDEVISKIIKFRDEKKKTSKSYKIFMGECRDLEIKEIYHYEINEGKTKTRESKDASLAKFIKTKASNLRDYTDACFRYYEQTTYEVFLKGDEKSDIIVFCCADFQQEYFSEKDFREKASIDGNLLKDIWDEVQELRYM